MKRAVGHCDTLECEEYLKGMFLLNPPGNFCCPRCQRGGFIERERLRDSEPDNKDAVYKTVRVHFNYSPNTRKYREIAIVDVNELKLGGLYDIYSPLIKTERRALSIAENVLCCLNTGMKGDENAELGRTSETVINLSHDDWTLQLSRLGERLAERERRIYDAIERGL
jgi:hypothetical protein